MSILSSGTSNTTALVYTSDTTGNLVFQTNGTTEAMRIDTVGNVGIGTATPGSSLRLDVQAPKAFARIASTTTTNETYLRLDNNGQFYIGLDNSTGSAFTLNNYAPFLYSSTNAPMSFFTNGVKRLDLDTSGNLNVKTAGGGISFNNSSALTNSTLNDYETGTWTPGAANMTISGTLSSAGKYTKIGNIVFYWGYIVATGSIAWSASALITGLPFVGTGNSGQGDNAIPSVKIDHSSSDALNSNYAGVLNGPDVINQRIFIGQFSTAGANIRINVSGFYFATF